MKNFRHTYSCVGRCHVLIAPLLLLLLFTIHTATAQPQQAITIMNDVGESSFIKVFWVHPETKELHAMSQDALGPKATQSYNAYVGHEFEIQEVPNPNSGECDNEEQVCRRTLVEVTGKDADKFVVIDSTFMAYRLLDIDKKGFPGEEKEQQQQPTKSEISILNKSGSGLDVYWIHPQTKAATKMTVGAPVRSGDTLGLQTFVGHQFEVRQTGTCEVSTYQPCHSIHFQHPLDVTDPTIVITKEFQAMYDLEVLGESLTPVVETAFDDGNNNNIPLTRLLEHCTKSATTSNVEDCIQHNIGLRILQQTEALAFEHSLREDVAAKLENFTCKDDTLDTSPPVNITTWHSDKDDTNRTVWIMLDRPASKIHLVHDFISDEECTAMEEAAETKLSHGTVADGKGGVHTSEHRKALQAAINVPWDKEADGNPIAQISRRVYDYVNHVLDLNIQEFGQENIMSIQYQGRGFNDSAPDQYMPHCDGDCDGSKHKPGTRMATMVMYCMLPERGGHTNFRNANVHVKPQEHMAVFFSYMDPATNLTDTQFTEHSGCPVWEGDKKIVTQWVRYGVSAERPWTSLNTMGIPKEDAKDW